MTEKVHKEIKFVKTNRKKKTNLKESKKKKPFK